MTARREGSGRPADQLRESLLEHETVAAAVRATLLPDVRALTDLVCAALERGNHLYTFGNGGSAADAQHLAAELIGHYRQERRALPAVCLSTDTSALTAIGNDFAFEELFARQVQGLVRPGDVVVAFSTSGESENVVRGLAAAARAGATTVALTGARGGRAADLADLALRVPSDTTARIQEMHVLIIHLLSESVDGWATGEGAQLGS